MKLLSCVIGTAGHIDHGKTMLVEALTGVNCDRFEEEKRRGITIDIGFAPLTLNDGRMVGIVDVPGHQRFVRNMLAGAAGVDLALLVIAADDGVMPQTVEHLAILELLKVNKGVVALTKADMVDEETLELARLEVEELIESSILNGARIIPCSALTGRGIKELKSELEKLAFQTPSRTTDAFFRMPIDRVFTIKGHGVVITGTVSSGSVGAGDKIALTPGGLEARVKRIQNHGEQAESAHVGTRSALNITGPEKSGIKRGMVACHTAVAGEYKMFTADITCHKSSPRVISHGRSYLLHVHTAETLARVYLSTEKSLKPGESCVGQIRFNKPLNILHADRFVLRSSSARHTLGGGMILEPGGVPLGKRGLLASMSKWEALGEKQTGVATVIKLHSGGAPLEEVMRVFNIPEKVLLSSLKREGDFSVFEWKGARHAVSRDEARRITNLITGTVEKFHEDNPSRMGMEEQQIMKTALAGIDERLATYWIRKTASLKGIEYQGAFIRLPGREARFTGENQKLRSRILDVFTAGGLAPPRTDKVHTLLGVKKDAASEMIRALTQMKDLVTVAPDYTLSKATLAKAEIILRDEIKSAGFIETGRYRDLLGVGRKAAIDILEYFDKKGLTKRSDDKGRRVLRQKSE